MAFSPDQILKNLGLSLGPSDQKGVEGYMTEAQRAQFSKKLQEYAPVFKVAEIGLNVGHSAENFFACCNQLQKFVSFDVCFHPYTEIAAASLAEKHKERFHFVRGNSKKTVLEYAARYPGEVFDLIYIDGNHMHEYCFADIQNCAKLAKANTKVWIDDYQYTSVFLAVHEHEYQGLIRILQIHESKDPNGEERQWVEAEYV